ncbi:hypothetical protein M433DRAFT_156492 [Acidomyces richmondensis BFW]|nr:MAG: hypothetical protein FE78DRAFT_93297 [Acidomyces sp. 'richmondensis']KYG43641.1 hypothetical protein M433DRAFT_156492 [Acidomyces richmondensis BFW]
MDELRFQQELQQLKQKVDIISTGCSKTTHSTPRLSNSILPPLPNRDPFLAQVDDVKAHLASLEEKADNLQNTSPGCTTRSALPSIGSLTEHMRVRAATRPTIQSSPEMLSTPQMQQLYFTMRDEMQDLNGRLALVERAVSEVEDRLDGFDPNRFTPSGSEATVNGLENHEIDGSITRNDCQLGKVPTPAFIDDFERFQNLEHRPEEQSRLLRVQTALHTLRLMQLCAGRFARSDVKLPKTDAEALQRLVELNSQLLYHVGPLLDRNVDPNVSRDETSPLPQSSKNDLLKLAELPETRSLTCHNSSAISETVPAEGVAFRDQEISRMDELLRSAQESLRASEVQVAGTSDTIAKLQSQYDERIRELKTMASEALERERNLDNALQTLKMRDDQISELKEALDWQDRRAEQWREAYYQLKHDTEERSAGIQVANAQISHLQRLLEDCQNSKDDEIDQIVAHRDREIRKLQEFCEQKDAVVSKQDQIIARGARLLEDRDEEIEEANRKMKVLEDEKNEEARQSSRLAKKLSEREAELSKIKSGGMLRDLQPATACWSPQPLKGSPRLPHEARRASVWEKSGGFDAGPKFGQPSPLGARSSASAGSPPDSFKRIRYLNDKGEVIGQPPSLPNGPQDSTMSTTKENAEVRRSVRQQLPLDRTFLPPLPAPATAHKVHSMADLRSAAHHSDERPVSKRQSVQELPSVKNHQAYVETEGENEEISGSDEI